MVIKTQGLVVKQRNIGERDNILTILSGDLGLLEASARGVKSLKSKLLSGTQPLCFSEFTLYQGKNSYVVNEAQAIENFYDIRMDVEAMALASYFCELVSFLAPQEDNASPILGLMLHTLYYLCAKKRSALFLKSVFELKVMCLSGFAPDLIGCCRCGAEEKTAYLFFPGDGVLCCESCDSQMPGSASFPVNKPILSALRFITQSDLKRMFQFKLEDRALEYLNTITEYYVLYHCGRGFQSLNFYKNLPK